MNYLEVDGVSPDANSETPELSLKRVLCCLRIEPLFLPNAIMNPFSTANMTPHYFQVFFCL